MGPKKARGSPAKARAKKPHLSEVLPTPLPSSPASSQASTPRSPAAVSTTRAPTSSPSPPPSPVSSGTAASRTASGTRRWVVRAASLLVVVVAAVAVCLLGSGGANGSGGVRQHHPCACAAAASASNPLARAVLSGRSGVSGVHWQPKSGATDRLDFASTCSDMLLSPLHGPFATVDQLREEMQRSFARTKSRCVVWVTSPAAVQKVANALKELLENNALGGTSVVPQHARGMLVMKSPLSREELKDTLPHRVVHMLTNVN